MKKPTDPVTSLWNCVHCGAINSGELKNCKNCYGRNSWTVNGVTVAGETKEELLDVLNKILKLLDDKTLD